MFGIVRSLTKLNFWFIIPKRIKGLLNNRVVDRNFCYTAPRSMVSYPPLTLGAAHVPNGNGWSRQFITVHSSLPPVSGSWIMRSCRRWRLISKPGLAVRARSSIGTAIKSMSVWICSLAWSTKSRLPRPISRTPRGAMFVPRKGRTGTKPRREKWRHTWNLRMLVNAPDCVA